MTSSFSARGRASVLSVPAANPEMIAKALASQADEVVIDLEDAVAPGHKGVARELVRDLRAEGSVPRLAVRINQLRSPWGLRDLEAVVDSSDPIESIVLPKCESREDLAAVEQIVEGLAAEKGVTVPIGIQALVETATGLANLADIVSRRVRLDSIIIGYADLAASLGRLPQAHPGTWAPIQTEVLLHARAAGVEVVDGPHLGVADDEEFRKAVDRVVTLGFDAKWVIHPRQIVHVNTSFAPSEAAVERAQKVIGMLDSAHADGSGALALGGELIDEAMAVAARRVLAKVDRV